MAGLLRPDELASIQAAVAATFDTSVSILRSINGVYTDIDDTLCYYFDTGSTVTVPGAPSLLALTEWEFQFAQGTDVQPTDRLEIIGVGTWYVQKVALDSSLPTETDATAYQLFDGAGNAVFYIAFNATVSVTHSDSTVVYAARRVQLVPPTTPSETVAAVGQTLWLTLCDTPDGLYQPGDLVTITQQDGFTTLPPVVAYTARLVEHIVNGVPMVRVQLEGLNAV